MPVKDAMRPFDEYDLRARIFPALVVSLPVVACVYTVIPAARSMTGFGLGGLLEASALYFIARIARDKGAKAQKRLFKEWGGLPSTLFLRHRDGTIDPLTKARYKVCLAKLTGLEFPSESAEEALPDVADSTYASSVKALLEQRRDKKFRLIFLENCNYGFMRNLFGLRAIGLLLAVSTLSADAYRFYLKGSAAPLLISLVVSGVMLFLLMFGVSKHAVRRSADAYAHALLRSCEPGPPRPARSRRKPAEIAES